LRLCTAPNVLLNHHLGSKGLEAAGEGELDVEELGETFIRDVAEKMDSQFDFISGGWGEAFVDLVRPEGNLLVLASETIYSPDSTRLFAETLVRLLRRHSSSSSSSAGGGAFGTAGRAMAWVAAKKVYFGVGGGVDDFVAAVAALGGRCELVGESKDTGVGRVVLQVTV